MANHFRELGVYQQALGAAGDIVRCSRDWPKEERHALTDQIRRSAHAVSVYIAGAWRKRRYEAHFVSKLSDADAAAAETQSWLDAARDGGYLSQDEYASLDQKYERITGELVDMMNQSNKWCSSMAREEAPPYSSSESSLQDSSSQPPRSDYSPPTAHSNANTAESGTILDDIVADTWELVGRRQRGTPPSELEQRPLYDRTPLDFAAALQQDALAVIAEIKKASPSKGVIRNDFDVATFARHYEAGGAAALSVLTEPMHFQGHPENLTLAREAVDLPLLRKDFIIDPYQLVEAKAYGADAVLLIAAVLESHQLYDLHQAADELGLACLVEVYEEDELDKVDFDQVQILGVNNRNLRTFEVDLNHAPRIFERVPDGVTRVAESGLKTPGDLAHLQRQGVDAVLIGETLMRAEQPAEKLRALRRDLDPKR